MKKYDHLLGKKPPGGGIPELSRCGCGIVCPNPPCWKCLVDEATRGPGASAPRRRNDGHVPVLAAILALLVALWIGTRLDAVPEDPANMGDLD